MAVRVIDGQSVGELTLPLVARLLQRVNDLERQVREHEEWLTEIGEDLADVARPFEREGLAL